MTVIEVSERTRIRATIIRDIERDDYSSCGGDYYARGHIRAIARVVGADPVPLIEEYDAARAPLPEDTDVGQEAPADRPASGHPVAGRAAAYGRTAAGRLTGHPVSGGPVSRGRVPGGAVSGGPGSAVSGAPVSGDAPVPAGPVSAGPVSAGPVSGGPVSGGPVSGGAVSGSQVSWDPVSGSASGAGSGNGTRPRVIRSGMAPAVGGPRSGESGARPGGITAAEAFRPGMPLERPRGRLSGRTAVIVLVLLAAVGLIIYLLAGGSSGSGKSAGSRAHAATATGAGKHAATGKRPAPKPSGPKPSAAVQAAAPLTPVSATAFGPGGTAQGDNAQLAALAIDGSDSTSWQTDWYSTANFSGMQQGTGLLLDMGKDVTVRSVRLVLGATAGGSFELLAGDSPDLSSLSEVAQQANPGGTLTVPVTSPVAARYLLIWFTSLPPDSSGTYQASVYDVSLSGTS
jgi:hypothetical protein